MVIDGEHDLKQLNANCKLIKTKIRIRLALVEHLDSVEGSPDVPFCEETMGEDAISLGDDDKEKEWAVWMHLCPKLETTVVGTWATVCLKIMVKSKLPPQLFTQARTLVHNANDRKVCSYICSPLIQHAHQCPSPPH